MLHAKPDPRGLGGRLCVLAAALALPFAPAWSQVAPFIGNGKGLNLGSAVLATPSAGPGSPVAYRIQADRWSSAMLMQIKNNGFGLIRLVTTPAPLMTSDPQALDQAAHWVSAMVSQANAAGLGVIVDLHFWPTDMPLSQDTVPNDPNQRPALIRGQVALAAKLASMPNSKVALELLNEPYCQPSTGLNGWPQVQRQMVTSIRKVAPRLPLILTGCRGHLDTLELLDASSYQNDRNLYWTFHYYDFFGEQEIDKLDGVPFPPNPTLGQSMAGMKSMIPLTTLATNPRVVGKLRNYLLNHHGSATIRDQMAAVAAWAHTYKIPPTHIFMGEFAALISNAPENDKIRPDQLRWLLAVRGKLSAKAFSGPIGDSTRQASTTTPRQNFSGLTRRLR